ncbi:MAG: ThuA domain-containing protein [Bacteroidota bacterium]
MRKFAPILILYALSSCAQEAEIDRIQVLILDGFSNHDWKQTTLVVRSILEESGLFSVAVSTAPVEDSIKLANWLPDFSTYDVVIQNTNNVHNKALKWPRQVELDLEEFVKKGGGLYILHSANNAFPHWEEYNEMIGLGWRSKDDWPAIQISDDGTLIMIPVGEGKSTTHGPRTDETIYKLTDHPINKGFPDAWTTPDMELYEYPRGPAKNLTVLSYAYHEDTNINWPVEWVVDYGEGRVYSSSMGHLWTGDIYPPGYRCVGFQTTLIRATEWLASGKTSYKLPQEFPSEFKMVVKPK